MSLLDRGGERHLKRKLQEASLLPQITGFAGSCGTSNKEKDFYLVESAHQGASVSPSLGREGSGGFDTKTLFVFVFV